MPAKLASFTKKPPLWLSQRRLLRIAPAGEPSAIDKDADKHRLKFGTRSVTASAFRALYGIRCRDQRSPSNRNGSGRF